MTRPFLIGTQPFAIEINPNVLRRVRRLTQFRLEDVVDLSKEPSAIATLTSDVVLLVDVLYAVLEPQCQAIGWTAEKFGESLTNGDVLREVTEALLYGLDEFFHPGRRAPLRTILERAQAHRARLAEVLPAVDAALERAVDKELEKMLLKAQGIASGGSSGTTPASSA